MKIAASLAAPHLTDDPELVAGYLGLANGLGFLAGATVGYFLLRASLNPPGGRLVGLQVVRTILVTISASLIAGLVAHVVDKLLGLESLTSAWGGGGSLLRLLALGLIMTPIIVGVLLAADVPEAQAALAVVQRRFGGRPRPAPAPRGRVASPPTTRPDRPPTGSPLTYARQWNSSVPGRRPGPPVVRHGPPASVGDGMRKGPAVSNEPAGGSPPGPDNTATTKIPLSGDREPPVPADDFQPDVQSPADANKTVQISTEEANGTAPMPASGRPPSDYGGDPTRESLPFDVPREPPIEAATSDEDVHLIPGAIIGGGRYRLLVFHGGPPTLQFWQALDTALDRQVALTFVDPDATLPDGKLQEILSRTLKLSRLDMPGVARVLDVANTGSGGLVVSEWIRGGSLAEVAETSPSPIGGARAIQSLAAAAEAAHRAGVALSIDHPSRVRVSIDGDVALAFPATLPDATPEDDIRGIGAALYALLDQPVAVTRIRCAQRIGACRPRSCGPARRTPLRRPRDSVPDLRRRRPCGSGGRGDPQCADAAEPAAAGHRDRRPHRAHLPRRRTRVAAPATVPRAPRRRPRSAGTPPEDAHDRTRRSAVPSSSSR